MYLWLESLKMAFYTYCIRCYMLECYSLGKMKCLTIQYKVRIPNILSLKLQILVYTYELILVIVK
jgi:hypothetical protein